MTQCCYKTKLITPTYIFIQYEHVYFVNFFEWFSFLPTEGKKTQSESRTCKDSAFWSACVISHECSELFKNDVFKIALRRICFMKQTSGLCYTVYIASHHGTSLQHLSVRGLGWRSDPFLPPNKPLSGLFGPVHRPPPPHFFKRILIHLAEDSIIIP